MSNRKSKYMERKPRFIQKLRECEANVVAVFTELVCKAHQELKMADWGYTDDGKFRIHAKHVAVEFWIQKTCVKVLVRVPDAKMIEIQGVIASFRSINVNLKTASQKNMPVRDTFECTFLLSGSTVPLEAITLIKEGYKHSL